ncbi:biotin/lipoyl-binding protein [Comamonas endophytica]|uniref:biotin/lipoyl-binding protein n=1 Tax=Comamonas endophytica TaxID=2949090 RepID=UPI00361324A5
MQVIQSVDGGVLEQLLVREGDRVEPGQLLARLEQTRFGASVGEVEARLFGLQAKIVRLRAEVTGEGRLAFPADLVARSGKPRASRRPCSGSAARASTRSSGRCAWPSTWRKRSSASWTSSMPTAMPAARRSCACSAGSTRRRRGWRTGATSSWRTRASTWPRPRTTSRRVRRRSRGASRNSRTACSPRWCPASSRTSA